MKAATQQYKTSAARGRIGAAHRQRRTHTAPRCIYPHAATAADDARILRLASATGTADCPETDAETHHDPADASVPRVLLIDRDCENAEALSALLMPEAHVIHAATLAEAQHLLRRDIFALIVIDPALPDGNGATLIPLIVATPVLVHAQREPAWRDSVAAFLPKPWTSQRRLWSTISRLLGVPTDMSAGD